MKRFLLDTSAVRSLRGDVLAEASAHARVEISPYVAWELLAHIDEGDFKKARGQFLKCRFVTPLDDPRATYEEAFDIPNPARIGKLPDTGLINLLLRMLGDATSLAEFYAFQFEDPFGVRRGVDDLASAIRKILTEEEENTRTWFLGIVDHMRRTPQVTRDDEGIASAVDAVVDAWIEMARESPTWTASRSDAIFDWRFFSSAYAILRGLRLFETGAKFDGNDAQDFRMVSHLRVSEDCVFVTGDTGLKAALDRSIRLLACASVETPCSLATLSVETFRAMHAVKT